MAYRFGGGPGLTAVAPERIPVGLGTAQLLRRGDAGSPDRRGARPGPGLGPASGRTGRRRGRGAAPGGLTPSAASRPAGQKAPVRPTAPRRPVPAAAP